MVLLSVRTSNSWQWFLQKRKRLIEPNFPPERGAIKIRHGGLVDFEFDGQTNQIAAIFRRVVLF
jgi:glutamine synthetase adenylyltransferase